MSGYLERTMQRFGALGVFSYQSDKWRSLCIDWELPCAALSGNRANGCCGLQRAWKSDHCYRNHCLMVLIVLFWLLFTLVNSSFQTWCFCGVQPGITQVLIKA